MDLEYNSNRSDVFDPSTPKTSDRRSLTNEPVAAPYAGEDGSLEEDFICRECKQVDWDSLPTLAETLEHEVGPLRTRTLRTMEANHEPLATSSCKMCRILSAVKHQSLDKMECILGARSLLGFDHWTSRCKITALHVCLRHEITRPWTDYYKYLVAIKRDGEDFRSRMITPTSIDYNWLRQLARSCEENHKWCCRRGSLGPVLVSGLKVIEVASRTVIEAPAECRYVALSYVWGKQPDISLSLHLQWPPQLIEDAISVTIAMGYEYLWIDKYCIPQTDSPERHRMINQIDQVYAKASLTIIDASGWDARSGLPGVSSFPRRPQKCVHIRNTTILELPGGEHELNSSKWATRGWTYQEGYFSARRLIFTPSQVLFLCNENYREEFVGRLLQESNPEYTYDMERFSHLIPGLRSDELMVQLREYSQRELTHPGDSLNAFLGVLNFHTHESRRRASPILHVSHGLVAQKKWMTGDLRVYLDWYHEAPAERRPEFPSWSWTGWGGPLKFKDIGITLHNRGNDSRPLSHVEWEISWEPTDHKAVTIWKFANDSLSTPYTDKLLHQQPIYPNRLKVTCLVVPIRLQVVPLTEAQMNKETEIHFGNERDCIKVKQMGLSSGIVPVFQFWKGIYFAAAAYLDQDLDIQDCVIGLIFSEDRRFEITAGCRLARKLEKGLYERVGAIPILWQVRMHKLAFKQGVFLDNMGSVLDKVEVSAKPKRLPLHGIGERRTIFLV